MTSLKFTSPTAASAKRKRTRRLIAGGVLLLIVLLVAAKLLRSRANPADAQPITPAQATAAAPSAGPVIDLQTQDYTVLRQRTLQRSLPVSGTLRAVNSALVKARVSGELQELTLREGDTVKAGQIVARIDPAEYEARLRQARLQADAAKAQRDIAQRQHDNNEALVKQGFISQTALDTSLAQLNAGRASFEAAVAAADVAQKSADDTVLRAPMSGQIAQRLVQPGERVSVDARIVEIVDLSHMEIEAAISASDSVSVRVGQQARLQVEGLANPLPARVARINPSTQAGSRSVLVYLQLDPVPGLRQGLFAQGSLATETTRAIAAPLSAVRYDKPLPYLQLLTNDAVQHVSVSLGLRGREQNAQAQTRMPGDEGELVAIQALDGSPLEGRATLQGMVGALREGTQVRYIKSAAPTAPATPIGTAPGH